MMIKMAWSFLCFLLLSSPCVSADVTVAVAANMRATFEELRAVFEKESGVKVKAVYGSSGKFASQIANGAPFDVFLSADMDYPRALQKAGLTHNAPAVYARGTLVLWTLASTDVSKGLSVLAEKDVGKIAMASPQSAPYGRQAVNALKRAELYTAVHQKLVYGESIGQTNQFITTKAVDCGITAKATVLAPDTKDKGRWVPIDPSLYEPIAQGIVILKQAQHESLTEAQKLFDFILSPAAAPIFQRYGYLLPSEDHHE